MFIFLMALESEEEKEKFEILYKKYKAGMYRIAWNILKNERDAEDIVHESFWAIIENFEKIYDVSCHKTWNYIVTIVKNKAINLYNEKKRHENISYEENWEKDSEEQPLDIMVKKEQIQILAMILEQLPYPYKEVIYLQYYNELSGEEIGKVIGKSPENVRKISQRAKKMMKDQLKKRGVYHAS